MAISECIREILLSIPKGCIFDSHFIINRLIVNHSDEYLLFASNFINQNYSTLAAHGQIGKEVAKFNSLLVNQLNHKSWSINIHNIGSECTAWEKL